MSDKLKRIKRWEQERVPDAMQARLDRMPDAMGVHRQTVEHSFETFKSWMGMSLHVLAYNMKRVIAIIAVGALLRAIRA
jgi:hypothetical protein